MRKRDLTKEVDCKMKEKGNDKLEKIVLRSSSKLLTVSELNGTKQPSEDRNFLKKFDNSEGIVKG